MLLGFLQGFLCVSYAIICRCDRFYRVVHSFVCFLHSSLCILLRFLGCVQILLTLRLGGLRGSKGFLGSCDSSNF